MGEEANQAAPAETPPPKTNQPMTYKRYAPSAYAVRAICCGLFFIILLAGITALALYLVYRPSKPRFSVMGAAVYDLNISSPTAISISTSMQFTIISRNPSGRSSIFYDRLAVYVTYRNQAITPPTPLADMYLDRGSTLAVSPVVGSSVVPVSEDVSSGLTSDQTFGVVSIKLVVMGRIKYKSGPFHSLRYGMFVTCDLLLSLKKDDYGQVPMLDSPECHVNI